MTALNWTATGDQEAPTVDREALCDIAEEAWDNVHDMDVTPRMYAEAIVDAILSAITARPASEVRNEALEEALAAVEGARCIEPLPEWGNLFNAAIAEAASAIRALKGGGE